MGDLSANALSVEKTVIELTTGLGCAGQLMSSKPN